VSSALFCRSRRARSRSRCSRCKELQESVEETRTKYNRRKRAGGRNTHRAGRPLPIIGRVSRVNGTRSARVQIRIDSERVERRRETAARGADEPGIGDTGWRRPGKRTVLSAFVVEGRLPVAGWSTRHPPGSNNASEIREKDHSRADRRGDATVSRRRGTQSATLAGLPDGRALLRGEVEGEPLRAGLT